MTPADEGRALAAMMLGHYAAGQADLWRDRLPDIPDPHARAVREAYVEAMQKAAEAYQAKRRQMEAAA